MKADLKALDNSQRTGAHYPTMRYAFGARRPGDLRPTPTWTSPGAAQEGSNQPHLGRGEPASAKVYEEHPHPEIQVKPCSPTPRTPSTAEDGPGRSHCRRTWYWTRRRPPSDGSEIPELHGRTHLDEGNAVEDCRTTTTWRVKGPGGRGRPGAESPGTPEPTMP